MFFSKKFFRSVFIPIWSLLLFYSLAKATLLFQKKKTKKITLGEMIMVISIAYDILKGVNHVNFHMLFVAWWLFPWKTQFIYLFFVDCIKVLIDKREVHGRKQSPLYSVRLNLLPNFPLAKSKHYYIKNRCINRIFFFF